MNAQLLRFKIRFWDVLYLPLLKLYQATSHSFFPDLQKVYLLRFGWSDKMMRLIILAINDFLTFLRDNESSGRTTRKMKMLIKLKLFFDDY